MNNKCKIILAIFFSQMNVYSNYQVFYENDGILIRFQNNYRRSIRRIFIHDSIIDLINRSSNFILMNTKFYLLNTYMIDVKNVNDFLRANIENSFSNLKLLKILSSRYPKFYTDESVFILNNIKRFCREMNNILNEGKPPMTPRNDFFIQLIEDLEKIDNAYQDRFDEGRLNEIYRNLKKDLINAQNWAETNFVN